MPDVRHAILVALAAVPLTGCPSTWNCNPDQENFELDEPVTADELDELVAGGFASSWETLECDTVCDTTYRDVRGWETNGIESCLLTLPHSEDDTGEPGRVVCSGRGLEHFCKGRRPLGHVELGDVPYPSSLGRMLAAMAHLEAASVLAFEQLAERLTHFGAPFELVERCRMAAQDERNHARWMTCLASEQGAVVPIPRCASVETTLFDEAMHNAVEGCVSETFAALLATHRARETSDPALRQIFTKIAADETVHGQLAWDLHAWFRARLDPEQQREVDSARTRALASLPQRAPHIAASEPGLHEDTARALADALSATLAA
jgi:hypothetical protein